MDPLGITAATRRLSRFDDSADVGGIESEHVGGQLSTNRVSHRANRPVDALSRGRDQTILFRY
jgi:hypothetical protein